MEFVGSDRLYRNASSKHPDRHRNLPLSFGPTIVSYTDRLHDKESKVM
jgi:hypothetical protein